MEVVSCRTHCFARKVDLHQRIHQVLPVAVEPENLPHPIHEGIVHWTQKSEGNQETPLLKQRHKS